MLVVENVEMKWQRYVHVEIDHFTFCLLSAGDNIFKTHILGSYGFSSTNNDIA